MPRHKSKPRSTDRERQEEKVRKSALVMVKEHLIEAIAIVTGPLEDAARRRERLLIPARAATSAHDPSVAAFAKADRQHAQLESLVALLKDARDHAKKGGT